MIGSSFKSPNELSHDAHAKTADALRNAAQCATTIDLWIGSYHADTLLTIIADRIEAALQRETK